jgi:dynein heavy chain
MGWDNLYKSWKNTLPTKFDEDQIKVLDHLVYIIVQPTIDYLRSDLKETAPTQDQNLVVSLFRILRSLLKHFDTEQNYNDLDKKQIGTIIESSFLFSATWSLCISVNSECRKPFDQYFKKICNGDVEGIQKLKHKIIPSLFDRGTIYDYCYLPETNEWKNWMDFTNKDEIDQFPKDSIVNEIIVTTVDTIRYSFM